MKKFITVAEKLQQKWIGNGMRKVEKIVRYSIREIKYPNEKDLQKLAEIIQQYDKICNDYQGTWQQETTDEINLRLSVLNGSIKVGTKREHRAWRARENVDPYEIANVVFQYHKAINNPKEMAIAESMARIWWSQNWKNQNGKVLRSIIEPLIAKYYK